MTSWVPTIACHEVGKPNQRSAHVCAGVRSHKGAHAEGASRERVRQHRQRPVEHEWHRDAHNGLPGQGEEHGGDHRRRQHSHRSASERPSDAGPGGGCNRQWLAAGVFRAHLGQQKPEHVDEAQLDGGQQQYVGREVGAALGRWEDGLHNWKPEGEVVGLSAEDAEDARSREPLGLVPARAGQDGSCTRPELSLSHSLTPPTPGSTAAAHPWRL
eukprot:scaffold881_cov387-Prasinococcus_capsulatus_cf.AAC.4